MITFEYTLIRRTGRKTVSISVARDNRVTVIAPKHVPQEWIEGFVAKKSHWVKEKIRYNTEVKEPYQPRQFADGELFAYLGDPLKLQVLNGPRPWVEAVGETLQVHVPAHFEEEDRRERIVALLTTWYRIQARFELEARLALYAARLGVQFNEVRIKTLKSRWGSCSSKGVLTFNWKLVMAPLHLVDYVVAHELCHLVHLNHSKAFWNLLESIIPDCKRCREQLKIISDTLEL
jgi:hypothetical protein